MSFLSRLWSRELESLPGYQKMTPSLHSDGDHLVVLGRYRESTEEEIIAHLQETAAAVVGMQKLMEMGHNVIASPLEYHIHTFLPDELILSVANNEKKSIELLRQSLPPLIHNNYLLVNVGDLPELPDNASGTEEDYITNFIPYVQMQLTLQDKRLLPWRDLEALLKYGVFGSHSGLNVQPAWYDIEKITKLLENVYAFLTSPKKINQVRDENKIMLESNCYLTVGNVLERMNVPVLLTLRPNEE